MALIEIFAIIIIHWIADFVLQTDWQAKNKSKRNDALLLHTSIYSSIWIIPAILILGLNGCLFFLITFMCHTITDYFTSRLNTKLWAKGDVHNFFVSIGFDQVLHYIQLFTTYYCLKNGI